ncbi:hypothetical protein CDL12_13338 [Handroanthus impetiginosus]|uniref:BZIP domain-containing protein n=1 Tax=Handroanthus impetiginosus TaxID=429701 RepID=A0A2G9H946_9LAMI|nr:hypothetical protein CDL12_13338 [Handroanthus impetiginosus]
MECSSGISYSVSSGFQNSSPEEDLMDQRRRRRMLSNGESARRSRSWRREKPLDEQRLDALMAQVTQLRKEHQQNI